MIIAMCNACNHFFRGKIHRLVVDGRDEKHYCNQCIAALYEWERTRRGAGTKPYNPGMWIVLTEKLRIWLMRRVMHQVPDGTIQTPADEKTATLPKQMTMRELRGLDNHSPV